MTFAEFDTPAPSCPLPIWHPARAHVPHADVAATWARHSTHDLDDDTAGEQQEEAKA